MTNASDFLEQQVYNHVFRNDTFAKPGNLSIGLTVNNPNDTDGAGISEVGDGNGYARVPGVSGDLKWNTYSGDGPADNISVFTFTTATADWGMVSGIIITDTPTHSGGNVLMQGLLTTPRDVKSGDTFRFSAGEIDITIT